MHARLVLPLLALALVPTAAAHGATRAGAERAVERRIARVYGFDADASCDRSRYLPKYTCMWQTGLELDSPTGRVCQHEGRA